jgi:hypothetical protein
MAGEGGFIYEAKIHNKLKSKKLVPKNFVPAGSDSNAPDAMFIYNDKDYKLELKLDLKADYGQGSFDYVNGKWVLGGAKTASAEEMRRLLKGVGIEDFANKTWGPKGPPNKGTKDNKLITKEDVASDYSRFKDAFLPIKSSALHSYYGSKSTYYIQIGEYGMYYMSQNPAGLDIPQFNPNLRIRIRLKRGGSDPIYNYRFTTALQIIGKPKHSNRNLDGNVDFLIQK